MGLSSSFGAGAVAEMVQPATFEDVSALLVWGDILLAASLVGFSARRQSAVLVPPRARTKAIPLFLLTAIIGLIVYVVNTPLTNWLLGLDTTILFIFAIIIATASGAGLGTSMETSLIRPLYERTIYQIMLTFGLAFIGAEIARSIWGRSGFTMPALRYSLTQEKVVPPPVSPGGFRITVPSSYWRSGGRRCASAPTTRSSLS
jgi:hypothetical protein